MASRTSEYYKKNPAARRRRLKQQAKYQKKPSQESRNELNLTALIVKLVRKVTVKMYHTAKVVVQNSNQLPKTEREIVENLSVSVKNDSIVPTS